MAKREGDKQGGFRIDLNRIISDPRYRRDILRRLERTRGPTQYRPGRPRSVEESRRGTAQSPGSDTRKDERQDD